MQKPRGAAGTSAISAGHGGGGGAGRGGGGGGGRTTGGAHIVHSSITVAPSAARTQYRRRPALQKRLCAPDPARSGSFTERLPSWRGSGGRAYPRAVMCHDEPGGVRLSHGS